MPQDYEVIAQLIKTSRKKTPVKVYLSGKLSGIDWKNSFFGNDDFGIYIGEWQEFSEILSANAQKIKHYCLENSCRNSALPIADYKAYEARIEPGAIIRDGVKIGKNAVVLMGAVINIGAEIGERTMIDMNCVIGARAIIGTDTHIGAGAVIAGVLEPPSADPVRIGNHVLVGANAVVLEGVIVGSHSVIGAGSVVTKDIPDYSVAIGSPARVVKKVDDAVKDKTRLLAELREL
ncbi:MAG: 2,3,4,5-tetrahydropyridine-2,6-dicarboxylate N-acetyltransferase [Candidatus Wallbacteria bacterium]|nr:2,3,4,5-tetrahydropyridine-2,6-dicarboxylate N-acetyltransferase [Candidatus Wallbacteria bacterium]